MTASQKINITWIKLIDRFSSNQFTKDDQPVLWSNSDRGEVETEASPYAQNAEVTVAYVSNEVHGKLKFVSLKRLFRNHGKSSQPCFWYLDAVRHGMDSKGLKLTKGSPSGKIPWRWKLIPPRVTEVCKKLSIGIRCWKFEMSLTKTIKTIALGINSKPLFRCSTGSSKAT